MGVTVGPLPRRRHSHVSFVAYLQNRDLYEAVEGGAVLYGV